MENKTPEKVNSKNKGCYTGIIIFASFFLIVYFLLSLSSASYTKKSPSSNNIQQAESKPAFEILSQQMKIEKYTRYITGRIKNNTNKTYGYVQVNINLYDINGNLLGSTLDNVNNLKPGIVWYFKAIVIDDKVKKFEIMDILYK